MPIPSPCKQLCTYDGKGYCAGCYRSVEEITNWIRYSDREKLEVYKNIQARKSGRPKDIRHE